MNQRLLFSLCFLVLVDQGNGAWLGSRPSATPTINKHAGQQIHAIIPTTKGQIGINPVQSDLGDAGSYWGDIDSTDTQYITTDETKTKWIGINTEYLSMDGTSTVQVLFATATAAANGHNVGDISVILPEGLANTLTKSIKTAIDTCGTLATTKFQGKIEIRDILPRQVEQALSCVFEYTKIDIKSGGTFDAYIMANKWLEAGVSLAQDAAPALVKFISVLGKEEAAKGIVWLAFYTILLDMGLNALIAGGDQSLPVVAKVNIPASGFASKPKDKGCEGDELVTKYSAPRRNCPCIPTIPRGIGGQPWDQIWTDLQQQWLSDVFDDQSGGSNGGQLLALASYTNPVADADAWRRMISYDSNKLSILVGNVLNGPDYVVDKSWNSVVQQAAKSGKIIIGYVRTGYLGLAHDFKTRLGSGDLASWASQIEQDVDKWYELYNDIGGIFFDEGWPECGPNNLYSDLYAHINAYTKRKHPGAYTVLNPGSTIAQCYEDTMDTLLTVPQDKVAEVLAISAKRHVGYLHLTDDDNPNPYDYVPNDAYMKGAMNGVSGGVVRKDAATTLGGSYIAGIPHDASVIASDYTSVTISWSAVPGALGYGVYLKGALVLEMPPSLTKAVVGMLKPGTSGLSLEVRTIMSSGSGGRSKLLQASTNSLPAEGSITNVNFKKEGDMIIYNADILLGLPRAGPSMQARAPALTRSISSSTTYQNLRNLGGCEKCGSYKLANGCLFTVNYVYACKSADPGAAGGGGSPYDPPLFNQLLVEEVPSELPEKLEFPASPMTSIRPSRRGWA
ncbi:uncharacterized protein RAG0_16592 [Rhynchosporium agropyri]|uniref:Uncharacterized protein n=1 Tax=Rhynchosporium agropyri TaxID=914238 RepID=A0A1E1LR44_9HELO|nr:uncharacterized protein RAG0_16592 [Rhynchosporium agropyri]